MRNLVIARITVLLQEYPTLMLELDITPDELDVLSNADLLDLFEEIFEVVE